MYCSPTCICNIKGEYLLELHNTYCSRINGFLLINNNYGGINRVLIFIKSMYPCNPRILVPAKINDSTMFESKINYTFWSFTIPVNPPKFPGSTMETLTPNFLISNRRQSEKFSAPNLVIP